MTNLHVTPQAVFAVCFLIAVWLVIPAILGIMSGWFRLVAAFPNVDEQPVLRLRGRSGRMAMGVNMNGILTISVCPSGLRIGMLRVFGPFCRSFLVPWDRIAVTRTTLMFAPAARLDFGNPVIGTLTIRANLADRLARAANGRWPEAGPFPKAGAGESLRRLVTQWAVFAAVGAVIVALWS